MAILRVLKAGRRRVGRLSEGIFQPIATSSGLERGAQACCNFTFAQLKFVRDQTCRYRPDLPLVCLIDHLHVLCVLLAAGEAGVPGPVLVLAVLLALEGKLRLHSSCRVAYVGQSARTHQTLCRANRLFFAASRTLDLATGCFAS